MVHTTVKRIVVLLSGAGSNMRSLAAACERGDVRGKVVAVVADRDCKGIKAADEMGIDTVVLEPKSFASREQWSEALRDRVLEYEPALVVSAGFMRILAPAFVDTFEGRLINLHPSLLPAFPGAHAVEDALAAGVKVTGTTVHFIDHEVDHGAILLQEAVPVRPNDTEESLHDRIKQAEHRLLPEACRLVLEGKVRIEDGRAVVE